MIGNFYTALLDQINTLNYPCVYGISHNLKGDYINIFHVDSYNIEHYFNGHDNSFYYSIQTQIKGNSDTSMGQAIIIRKNVHDLLRRNYFDIDDWRIVKVSFNNTIDINEGIDDGFSSSIIFTWLLGS